MVRYAVPQLPIGQNHAFIRCQSQGVGSAQVVPFFQGTNHAPRCGAGSLVAPAEQDRQVGKIIIEDKAGGSAITLAQSVAQSAVHSAEALQLLLRQDTRRRPNVTVHRPA